jgi:uncharacterized protein YqgV (UPF0045/DUF77 family)
MLDISMYPLHDDYIPPIDGVIAKLNSYDDVKVNTFATATTVLGDYDRVMDILRETLAWSHARFGKAVFVARLIPGYDLDE